MFENSVPILGHADGAALSQ